MKIAADSVTVGQLGCQLDPDPARLAAQSLALTMAYFRDICTDSGYEALLVHFQALSDALPPPDQTPAAVSA